MTFNAVIFSKHLVRAGALLLVAAGASACSTVPDWVDPTTWIGGSDEATAPDQTADNGTNNGQTPDLSTIPEKPQTPSTADEQKQVAQSLAADRARSQYSADALRGGTEPAAAPPPAEAPPATEDLSSNDSTTAPAEAPAPKPAQQPITSAPGTLPAEAAPAPATQVAEAAPPAPTAPAPGAMPAVPAVPAAAPQAPSDAALGFKPSGAPPLDATVAQFVPQPILSRYRQTAAIGPQPAVPSTLPASSDSVSVAANAPVRHRHGHKTEMGIGGPETMTGAVVANFDALQGASIAPSLAAVSGAPAAVISFPNDTTVLNAEAKDEVRAAAKAFLARGGQGFVRVIGYASSTGNLSSARKLVANFEHSQARANAVARMLIREGVPADKVLVEAAGAAQGSDGNGRRAEIYFQG